MSTRQALSKIGATEGAEQVAALKASSSTHVSMVNLFQEAKTLEEKPTWLSAVEQVEKDMGTAAETVIATSLAKVVEENAKLGGGAPDGSSWKQTLPERPSWEQIESAAAHMCTVAFAKEMDSHFKNGNAEPWEHQSPCSQALSPPKARPEVKAPVFTE